MEGAQKAMSEQDERRKRASDAICKMFSEIQLIDAGGNLDLHRLSKEVAKLLASEAAEARMQLKTALQDEHVECVFGEHSPKHGCACPNCEFMNALDKAIQGES